VKEVISLFLIYMLFLLSSLLLYKKGLQMKKSSLYFYIPAYFVSLYLYFELINYLHVSFRERGYFIEFGHASVGLILLMIISIVTGLLLVIQLFLKRKRINK